MNAAERRSARAALDAARPAVARLDGRRSGEDLAADLVEIWGAVESALRSIVGGSSLSGQQLIRDARQRQALTFEQANTLAAFYAVRDRLQRTTYAPNEDDVKAAREAYLKLDAALVEPELLKPAAPPPGAAISAAAATESPRSPEVPPAGRRRPVWLWGVAVAVLVLVVVGGIWAYKRFGPRPDAGSVAQGISLYQSNQREAAVGAFNKAVREDPTDPLPHVYLARMAREVGNYPLTLQELQLALQANSHDEVALREMGAYFLTIGNYDMARRFYVDALKIAPTDKIALGYLGCSLSHLGRQQEATVFFDRAGQGAWSSCTAGNPSGAIGAVPNAPGVIPR